MARSIDRRHPKIAGSIPFDHSKGAVTGTATAVRAFTGIDLRRGVSAFSQGAAGAGTYGRAGMVLGTARGVDGYAHVNSLGELNMAKTIYNNNGKRGVLKSASRLGYKYGECSSMSFGKDLYRGG